MSRLFSNIFQSQVKKSFFEDVNKVIRKYFKDYENWTVVNVGDFDNFEKERREKK